MSSDSGSDSDSDFIDEKQTSEKGNELRFSSSSSSSSASSSPPSTSRRRRLLIAGLLLLAGLNLTHRLVSRHREPRGAVQGYLRAFGLLDSQDYGHGQAHTLESLKDHAKIEETFLSIPNNESAIAASRSYTGFAHIGTSSCSCSCSFPLAPSLASSAVPVDRMMEADHACLLAWSAAGRAGDFRTAQIVKNQWEHLLGLPESKSTEKIFDAGSKASRRLMTGGPLVSHDQPRVWIDTYYVLLK